MNGRRAPATPVARLYIGGAAAASRRGRRPCASCRSLLLLAADGPADRNVPPPPAREPERLGALAALLPYLARYRGRALAALAALVAAALATLAVPLAIRRMIDVGFSG